LKARTVAAVVIVGALGSAAALALDLNRQPAARAGLSQLIAPNVRGVTMMQPAATQVLYVPPVTIAAPWPAPSTSRDPSFDP